MEGLERSGISDGEVKEVVDSRTFKVESEEEENTSHRWSRDLADLGRSSAAPVHAFADLVVSGWAASTALQKVLFGA